MACAIFIEITFFYLLYLLYIIFNYYLCDSSIVAITILTIYNIFCYSRNFVPA